MEKQDILDSQTQRTKGVDALNSNIEATKALSQIIKTTLGPQGMDKMLIDSTGESIITNDGVKILQEMEIEHPGAQLLVEVAKTQEQEIGDGTTSAVILAGELLSQAQELLNKGIHPTLISKVFKQSSLQTLEFLNSLSHPIKKTEEKTIKDIASTAMTGKLAESSKEQLSKLLFESVSTLKDITTIDKNSITIVKSTGGAIDESSLVHGVVLDKMKAHPNMVNSLENPKVLLTDSALEVQELENQANISIQNAKEYQDFLEAEQEYLQNLAQKIIESGANIVVSQKGIDDNLAYFLAKQGIIAIRRCKKSDLEKLQKALNSSIISSLDDISKEHIGSCENVEVKTINDEEYVFFEGCPNPQSLSLLLRASTKQTVDELERAINDALGVIRTIINSKEIVAGGGAIEIELHKQLLEYSKTLPGKEQLIAQHFANSILSIPNTLCENAGFEKIETISTLISYHEKGYDKAGLNGDMGIINNTMKSAIIEPSLLKSQAISSATETAIMILRIDDIIAAKQLSQNNQ